MTHLLIIAVSISSMFTTNAGKSHATGIRDAEPLPGLFQSYEDPCNEGDDEDPVPMLSGSVTYNTNVPIYHACVEIKTLGGSTVFITGTDGNGHYYFNSVANGSYMMVFSASGFTTQYIPVTVSGTPQPVDAVLY